MPCQGSSQQKRLFIIKYVVLDDAGGLSRYLGRSHASIVACWMLIIGMMQSGLIQIMAWTIPFRSVCLSLMDAGA